MTFGLSGHAALPGHRYIIYNARKMTFGLLGMSGYHSESLDPEEGSLSDSEISVSSHWWCPG